MLSLRVIQCQRGSKFTEPTESNYRLLWCNSRNQSVTASNRSFFDIIVTLARVGRLMLVNSSILDFSI